MKLSHTRWKLWNRLYSFFWVTYFMWRFGVITEKRYHLDTWGPLLEADYRATKGKWKGQTIGYWAYGYFDPRFPYTGQPANIETIEYC